MWLSLTRDEVVTLVEACDYVVALARVYNRTPEHFARVRQLAFSLAVAMYNPRQKYIVVQVSHEHYIGLLEMMESLIILVTKAPNVLRMSTSQSRQTQERFADIFETFTYSVQAQQENAAQA